MSSLEKSKEMEIKPEVYVESGEVNQFDGLQVTWFQQFRLLWTSRRAVLIAVACSSSAIMIGYDLTLIGSIIANKEFIKSFGSYDISLKEWMLPASRQLIWSVVQYCSAMSGALAVGALNDIFGRRICFYITVLLTLIGAVVELVSPTWKVWLVAKICFGAAMGFMQGNTPVYVSELAPVHIRGFMLSLFQFWIILGSFLASCVLEGTSSVNGAWSWKAAVVSQIALGVFCLLIFFPLVPESPYYLIVKSRENDAKDSLLKLRGSESGYDCEADINTIKYTLALEMELNANAVKYFDCFKGSDLRRTLLAAMPMMMQMFVGYPLVGNYLAYFLTLSGIQDAFLITAISVMFSMFAVITAFFLIEYVGRRKQYLGGVIGMLPCLLAISMLGFVGYESKRAGQALAALAILFNIGYYLSVGAVGWTIVGEISSSRLRSKTASIAVSVNQVFNMAFSIAIPYLINADEANLGPKAGLVFFGPALVLAFVSFFCLPETKNKTFAELDELFKAGTPARKF